MANKKNLLKRRPTPRSSRADIKRQQKEHISHMRRIKNARRRGEDITQSCYPRLQAVKEERAGTEGGSVYSEPTGPIASSSSAITEAAYTKAPTIKAVPEFILCDDFRNQESTVSPIASEPYYLGLCRCCLVQVSFKRCQYGNMSGELTDTYSDMLLTTFGITVTQVQVHSDNTPAMICGDCKTRLQNAFAFKQQVLAADKSFAEQIKSGFFHVYDSKISDEPDVADISVDIERKNYNSEIMDDPDESDRSHDAVVAKRVTKSSVQSQKQNNNSHISVDIERINYSSEIMDDCDESDRSHDAVVAKHVTKSSLPSRKKKNKPPGDDDDMKCDICGVMQDNCVMLSYHVKRYHHRCDKCYKMFRNKYERIDHERTHPRVCEPCNEEFETSLLLRAHMVEVHKTKKTYKCADCKLVYVNYLKMLQHRAETHGAPVFTCGACHKVFYIEAHLSTHHRVHHMMERNYPCTQCDYRAGKAEDLKRHMIRHSKVKNLECQYCHKKFARPATLRCHERIHTGDKRQVCTLCGAAFVQRASLKYHLEKQHPGQI